MIDAQVGGQLNLSGARLASAMGPALAAEGIRVQRDLSFGAAFTADGEINLENAEIVRLKWVPSAAPAATMKLVGAHVGDLNDVVDLWPTRLHLNKLTYETLRGISKDSLPDRLEWLRRAEVRGLPAPLLQPTCKDLPGGWIR